MKESIATLTRDVARIAGEMKTAKDTIKSLESSLNFAYGQIDSWRHKETSGGTKHKSQKSNPKVEIRYK